MNGRQEMSKSELRRLNIQFEDKIKKLEAELEEKETTWCGHASLYCGMSKQVIQLEAELAAHKENEGEDQHLGGQGAPKELPWLRTWIVHPQVFG